MSTFFLWRIQKYLNNFRYFYSELFTTVLDMLATLIHSTQVSDNQSERDETKKLNTNLMKKLKKELADKNSTSVKLVRQLLPLQKQTCEVIACEPVGNSTDTKVSETILLHNLGPSKLSEISTFL